MEDVHHQVLIISSYGVVRGHSPLLERDRNCPLLPRLCSRRGVPDLDHRTSLPLEEIWCICNRGPDVLGRHSCNNVEYFGCHGDLIGHLCALQFTRAIPLEVLQWSLGSLVQALRKALVLHCGLQLG